MKKICHVLSKTFYLYITCVGRASCLPYSKAIGFDNALFCVRILFVYFVIYADLIVYRVSSFCFQVKPLSDRWLLLRCVFEKVSSDI